MHGKQRLVINGLIKLWTHMRRLIEQSFISRDFFLNLWYLKKKKQKKNSWIYIIEKHIYPINSHFLGWKNHSSQQVIACIQAHYHVSGIRPPPETNWCSYIAWCSYFSLVGRLSKTGKTPWVIKVVLRVYNHESTNHSLICNHGSQPFWEHQTTNCPQNCRFFHENCRFFDIFDIA